MFIAALLAAACSQPTKKLTEVSITEQAVVSIEDSKQADRVLQTGDFSIGIEDLFTAFGTGAPLDDFLIGQEMEHIPAVDISSTTGYVVAGNTFAPNVLRFYTDTLLNGATPAFELALPLAGAEPRSVKWHNGILWVGDTGNNRVYGYDAADANAFTTSWTPAHEIGIDGGTLCPADGQTSGSRRQCVVNYPTWLDVMPGPSGDILVVSEQLNRRISLWDISEILAGGVVGSKVVLGQAGYGVEVVNLTCGGTTGSATPTACGFSSPSGVTFNPSNNLLYVGDANLNRYLIYDLYSSTGGDPLAFPNGGSAVDVLGQPDFVTGTGYYLAAGAAYDAVNDRAAQAPGTLAFTTGALYFDTVSGRTYAPTYGQCRIAVYGTLSPSKLQAEVQSLGWATPTDPGVTNPVGSFPQAHFENCEGKPNGYALADALRHGPSSVKVINGELVVYDQLHARIKVYADAEIPVTGGTGTTTTNPGTGDTTVTVDDGSGATYETTIPAGSDTSGASITVQNPNGNQPGIQISGVVLPPGETKSVDLAIGTSRVACVKDYATASLTPTGANCNDGVKVNLPADGQCSTFCVGDEAGTGVQCPGDSITCAGNTHPIAVTVQADGSYATYDGLFNTVIQFIADDDNDGTPDDEDLCLGTDLNGPVPTQSLKPNHVGDDVVLLGCNASQILACNPGNNNGLHKFGLTEGVQAQWLCDTDGDPSDCPKWVLECQNPTLPVCANDGDYDQDGVADAVDADETDSATATSTGLENTQTGAGDGVADCVIFLQ